MTDEGRRNGWEAASRWAFLLVISAGMLHLPALSGWWLWDDPQLLLHALRIPAAATLFDPASYRTLAAHTFTPLLPLSFKVDILIGGLSPRVAYAHQIIALVAAGLLLDQLLRRYVDRWVAVFAAVTFVACWMGVYSARTLMIRHYVEGLIAALAALILWSSRSSEGQIAPAVRGESAAGSFFWLIALLSKEIFAPLPLILVLQRRANGESWPVVARRLAAPALIGVVWLVWRSVMLASAGGYGVAPPVSDLFRLPVRVVRALLGPGGHWGGAVLVSAVAILTIAVVVRRPRRIGAVALLILAAVLPVAPLAANFEWRYAFAPAMVASAALALGAALALPSVRIQRGMVGLVTAVVLVAAPFAARAYARAAEPVEAEGRWLWSEKKGAVSLLGSSPSWYLSGVRELKQLSRGESAPQFAVSPEVFISGGLSPRRFVHWDSEQRRMVPVPGDQSLEDRAALERSPRPMRIEVSRRGDLLEWSFDAADAVAWTIVTLPEYAAWPVPASGSRRVPASEHPGFFYVVVEWSDGTWSRSSELPLPLENDPTRWTVR